MSAPVAPPEIVFPMAGVTLVLLAGHVLMLRKADMPESRRRIRIANAWVMLTLTPLVAGLFGYVTPAEPRAFVLLATACTALLGLMVVLALIDAGNNARLASIERRGLAEEAARLRIETARAIAEARRARETNQTPPLRLADDAPDDQGEKPAGP